ncbi:uncharacterized protein PFL1_04546 [Pseudozyma flocculosa PF-1]|uniref:Chitobiosyldiphosphodolichol beta-mannosyltransferase n=2 Tax=Pseudozyma flocculosa TaxID=84751 RepID=A0A5C3FC94_9BASI|nr:uncharacterized protein PFL1_04546 [Pseudozyma flocculosa PF-1]EPQ27801.1 hypothetical protein PFL1_04546 [Pseudozyma flocculosa PF-1]SPO41071.1 related to ALG1 - beta-mannosyltransferase [Pseudozyma flocculosa]
MLVLVLLAFCATLIVLIGLLFLVLYVALYRAPSTTSKASLGRSAAVVVLGDIGRSPRMCFHVESLANEGWKVAVVGYKGTVPPPPLRRPSIKHHHLRTPPAFITRLPRFAFALVAPIKVLFQSVSLFWELAASVQPPPEIVLVQTPPALPTLFIVRLVCALLGSRVIIDWHNLGYTILALRMGEKSPLVRLAEWLERITGRNAFAHLFVTNAMMKHLDRHWGLKGNKAVLHDRPPSHFRRTSTQEVHELMSRLAPQIRPSLEGFYPSYSLPESTPFTRLLTEKERASYEYRSYGSSDALRPDSPAPGTLDRGSSDGRPQAYLREDRPALVVSSTSWTADEDFTLLLHAARIYERRARQVAAIADSNSSRTPQRRYSTLVGDQIYSSPTREHSRTPLVDSFSSLSSPASEQHSQDLSLDVDATRTSKERRRPSFGTLRSATLPNEPAASLPKMVIVVTGKGELKASYEAEIRRLETEEQWEWVRIRTAWLESEDYPKLLGSADVGISLHSSSSGIDLPMKVVDMLGCGLPVCALDFNCLDELIHDGHNGLVFRDAEGLARQLESLLALHPSSNWLLMGEGMQNPFEPPTTTRSNSANASPRVSSGGSSAWLQHNAVPPSPNSSFTLLHSPGLGPDGFAGWPRVQRSRTSTWEGNWKTVVRPILHAADLERERERERKRGSSRSAAVSGRRAGSSNGNSSAIGLNLPRGERRQLLRRGSASRASDESDEDGNDEIDAAGVRRQPHGSSSPGFYQIGQRSGARATEEAGEEVQSPVETEGIAHAQNLPRSSRLRQRFSVRQTPTASQLAAESLALDLDLDDKHGDGSLASAGLGGTARESGIPHIQVSHAAT